MAISAGQVYVDLGARLDRGEFEKYERELKKVQARTAKREHFKAELGANFDARAFNAYERELKRADRANDNMVRSNGRLRTSFGSVWSRGGAAFAAAGGAFAVVTAVKSVTKAYGESQVSQEKMRAQLKALGIDYDAHAKQIDAVIQKTSQLAGLDDEDLQDAFTAIVRSTKSVNTGLKDMSLVADLARAKHMDVAKAGEFLAKIHAGNVGGLRRLGIEFTKSTDAVDHLKETTKKYTPEQLAAAKAVDKAHDSTRALGKLQERFKGQAEAYGKTQAGSMDRVKVAFENLQETIGRRLGPSLTRAANGLANFINEMGSGEGKGGRFVDVLQAVGHGFALFARAVRSTTNLVAGFFSDILRGFQALGEAGQHLPGVGGKFRKFAQDADRAADRIDDFRKKLRISVEAGKVNDDLESMRKKTGSSLTSIRKSVVDGMKIVRNRLGTDTDEGQKAVHRHFRSMVARIREAMRDGKIETADGLAAIHQIMLTELKELGIPSAQAKGKPLSPTPPKGGKVPVVKAGGGWIGAPGTVGYDTVPAMLAPGEAVLNRHQQAIIEGMLGDGFLDRLFATVDRPHYLARGGRIRMAVGGVTPAIASLIEELDSKGFHHGSTTGPGHDPQGYHPRGMAVDYGDGSNDMQRLWSVVFPRRRRFAELFGPTRVNPGPHLMHNGAGFQDAALQADHQDHIHMALAAAIGALGAGSASSALGATWKALKAPQTTMGGLLGSVVQGTLDRATSLANQRGRSLAKTASGDTGALSGFKGGGSNAANRALGKRMAAAVGWTGPVWEALDHLWTGESGWNATIPNQQGSGAYGIPQALPASKMASAGADWRTNPATQIKWGIGYIKARYGGPVNAYRTWLSRTPHWYARGKPGRPAAKKKPVKPTLSAKENRGITRSIARGEKGIVTFESDIQQMEREYGQMDRRFGITDEVLLVEQPDGSVTVDQNALADRLDELDKLIKKRKQIENKIRAYRRAVGRLIKSIREAVHRLTKALHAAKGKARAKERGGYRTAINSYEERLGELRPIHQTLGGDIEDARIDLLELRNERREVAGTIGTPAPPGDTGAGDTGTDAGTTAEPETRPPSPLELAEAAATELRTFITGRQDLLTSFGRDFVPAPQGAAYFSSPDPLTAAAGVRAFGASGTGGGLGGSTIINNYNQLPSNVQTWNEQMRFMVGG